MSDEVYRIDGSVVHMLRSKIESMRRDHADAIAQVERLRESLAIAEHNVIATKKLIDDMQRAADFLEQTQ